MEYLHIEFICGCVYVYRDKHKRYGVAKLKDLDNECRQDDSISIPFSKFRLQPKRKKKKVVT